MFLRPSIRPTGRKAMRRGWLKSQVRNRVIVYTTEEQVLDGVLTLVAADGVVLLDARVRSDSNVALQGEVYVPREKIRFAQVVKQSDGW